jgi:hypothetical protein
MIAVNLLGGPFARNVLCKSQLTLRRSFAQAASVEQIALAAIGPSAFVAVGGTVKVGHAHAAEADCRNRRAGGIKFALVHLHLLSFATRSSAAPMAEQYD